MRSRGEFQLHSFGAIQHQNFTFGRNIKEQKKHTQRERMRERYEDRCGKSKQVDSHQMHAETQHVAILNKHSELKHFSMNESNRIGLG